jgi:transposase
MFRSGKTRAEVAAHYGVSVHAVGNWLERVKEWEQDRVNREMT